MTIHGLTLAEPTTDRLPIYAATGPVVDGVEVATSRLVCCGAGPDQRDTRTTERLHLPGCPAVAAEGIAAARARLVAAGADHDVLFQCCNCGDLLHHTRPGWVLVHVDPVAPCARPRVAWGDDAESEVQP